MTNAELLAKIKAEIERRKRELDEQIVDIYDSKAVLRKDELQRLLSFISTLESEKPMQEELEEEIGKSIENLEGCTTKIGDAPEYHLISDEDLREFARHFAKWGAEHLADARKTSPKDLEEAAREYANQDCVTFISRKNGFIAGAKWQADNTPLPEDTVLFNKGVEEGKRLMMKEAVEGEIRGDIRSQEEEPYQIWAESDFLPLDEKFEIGDKVRIIIVKEEE